MKSEILVIIGFVIGMIVGLAYNYPDPQIDIDSFENKLEEVSQGEIINYLNENNTLADFKRYYYAYKPISSGLVKVHMEGICK